MGAGRTRARGIEGRGTSAQSICCWGQQIVQYPLMGATDTLRALVPHGAAYGHRAMIVSTLTPAIVKEVSLDHHHIQSPILSRVRRVQRPG